MKPADLARLFATEGPRLLRRLRRFRGRIAAEDVVQAAFAKMLEVDEAEIEERAIRRRAAAWTRIAAHYTEAGDREAADAIRDYVADHFDQPPRDPARSEGYSR